MIACHWTADWECTTVDTVCSLYTQCIFVDGGCNFLSLTAMYEKLQYSSKPVYQKSRPQTFRRRLIAQASRVDIIPLTSWHDVDAAAAAAIELLYLAGVSFIHLHIVDLYRCTGKARNCSI